MDLSDEDLVFNLDKTGDVEFFEILMNRYKNNIHNFILRYISSREDSEDLTQEIFVKVFFKISSFDSSKASFKPWLFTITKNSIYNKLKEKKMVRLTYDVEDTNNVVGDNDDIVQTGLNKLDKKYRLVLIMYYIEGFKYKEISEILKLPINTVKTRIKRGKLLLKNELKEYI